MNAAEIIASDDPLHKLATAESGIADNSVCSFGCSHCCYVPVEILEVEADFIAAKTGKTRVSDASLLVGLLMQNGLIARGDIREWFPH